jgi:hypothetical protein
MLIHILQLIKGGIKMAKDKKWLSKLAPKLKKGAFTDYCGGNVTNDCIQKGLKSPDATTRKRAALAKTFRSIKHK